MSASVFAGRCASPGEKDANTMRVYDDTRLSALISGEDDDAFGAADSPNPRNKVRDPIRPRARQFIRPSSMSY